MVNNVIIVAGGKGLRMGGELPKQFLNVGGKPILMRTIEAFHRFDSEINIVAVLPSDFKPYWLALCQQLSFNIPHQIAIGGNTRFHSVKNGLGYVKEGIVAVHDAARPFVSTNLIKKTFELAAAEAAVIPVINVTDSLRKVRKDGGSHIIDRSEIRQVQTPQVFSVDILKQAYLCNYDDSFTDDASVVEKSGVDVHLIEGEATNIKITTPFDLKIAEVILKELF